MDLTLRYRHYLEEQKLSPLSVKNYLADLNKFLAWLKNNFENCKLKIENLDFKSSDFQTYTNYLVNQQIPQASLSRYLSSLRQFGQFLFSCGETAANPALVLTTVKQNLSSSHLTEVDQLLAGFSQALAKEKLSNSTIRNYVVDVRQFLSWFTIQNES